MTGKINPHNRNIPASKPAVNASRDLLEGVDLVEAATKMPTIPASGSVQQRVQITRSYSSKSTASKVTKAVHSAFRPVSSIGKTS